MPYIVPSNPETIADQLLYTKGMLADVSCRTCAAVVQVRKNSPHHTSIQWTTDALQTCAAFAEMASADGGRNLHAACPRLVESIDAAVRDGSLSVGAAGADGVSADDSGRAEVSDE